MTETTQNKITISISGKHHTGKTVLAMSIAKLLVDNGVDVTVHNDEERLEVLLAKIDVLPLLDKTKFKVTINDCVQDSKQKLVRTTYINHLYDINAALKLLETTKV